MRTLALADLGNFLDLPLVATLATYRRSGEVLLSPVWHEWRDGGFNIAIGEQDAKARHLRRDNRASVVVYESEPPYRGLEVRGHAVLTVEGLREAHSRMWQRYLGIPPPEDLGEILARIEGPIRAWDFTDWFAMLNLPATKE